MFNYFVGFILLVLSVNLALAADLETVEIDMDTSAELETDIEVAEKIERQDRILTRGEAVDRIVVSFDLKATKKAYLADCMANADECFFVFAAMSDFDGIAFEPLTLYPDLYENLRYYNSIMTASALGLVHGYLEDEGTPFKPEVAITRVQALKIVLGAADLMRWKEKFELEDLPVENVIFEDVNGNDPDMWWYPRYINFALEADIVIKTAENELFRPDDLITVGELADFIDNTKSYLENTVHDSQIHTRGNPA